MGTPSEPSGAMYQEKEVPPNQGHRNTTSTLRYKFVLKALERYIGDETFSPTQKENLKRLLHRCGEAVREDLQAAAENPTLEPKTKLLNLNTFKKRAARRLMPGRRSHDVAHGTNYAIGMLDIRCMKLVNDTHGHEHGDKLIETVALVLQHELRKADLPTRYGGDEFCFFLTAKPKESIIVATRLKNAINEAIISLGEQLKWPQDSICRNAVRADIGLARFKKESLPLPAVTANFILEGLLGYADQEMYRAKRSAKSGGPDQIASIDIELNGGMIRPMNQTS